MRKFILPLIASLAVATPALADETRVEVRGGAIWSNGTTEDTYGVAAGFDTDIGTNAFAGFEVSGDKIEATGTKMAFGLTGRDRHQGIRRWRLHDRALHRLRRQLARRRRCRTEHQRAVLCEGRISPLLHRQPRSGFGRTGRGCWYQVLIVRIGNHRGGRSGNGPPFLLGCVNHSNSVIAIEQFHLFAGGMCRKHTSYVAIMTR
jgi:hypothetical protein